MPIERRNHDNTQTNNSSSTVATDCRLCEQEIPDGTGYAEHLQNDCPEFGGED